MSNTRGSAGRERIADARQALPACLDLDPRYEAIDAIEKAARAEAAEKVKPEALNTLEKIRETK